MVENYAQGSATIWDAEVNAAYNALAGFGIISGCAISKGGGDWDIDVTSGTVLITGTGEVSVSSGTVTLTAPASDADLDAGESRIDLITADTGGSLAAVEGTAATNPDSPDIPTDEVMLGFVVIAESDSTAADSTINDIPPLLGNDGARYEGGGSHELDIPDTANDAGTSSISNTTWIENTTGHPLILIAETDGGGTCQIEIGDTASADYTWTSDAASGDDEGYSDDDANVVTAIAPDTWFYKFTAATSRFRIELTP